MLGSIKHLPVRCPVRETQNANVHIKKSKPQARLTVDIAIPFLLNTAQQIHSTPFL